MIKKVFSVFIIGYILIFNFTIFSNETLQIETSDTTAIMKDGVPHYQTTVSLTNIEKIHGYQIEINTDIPDYNIDLINKLGSTLSPVSKDGKLHAGSIYFDGSEGNVELFELILTPKVSYDEDDNEIQNVLVDLTELPSVTITELQIVNDISTEEITTYGSDDNPFAIINFTNTITSTSNADNTQTQYSKIKIILLCTAGLLVLVGIYILIKHIRKKEVIR